MKRKFAMRNIGYLTSKHTKQSDEAYTPEYAVKPILEFIPKNWIIWCPFDTSQSAFVKMLKMNGNKVIFTHKNKGQDFFTHTHTHTHKSMIA